MAHSLSPRVRGGGILVFWTCLLPVTALRLSASLGNRELWSLFAPFAWAAESRSWSEREETRAHRSGLLNVLSSWVELSGVLLDDVSVSRGLATLAACSCSSLGSAKSTLVNLISHLLTEAESSLTIWCQTMWERASAALHKHIRLQIAQ